MNFPIVRPRRPLDDSQPTGYQESDNDFVGNNLDAAVWLLENAAELEVIFKSAEDALKMADTVVERRYASKALDAGIDVVKIMKCRRAIAKLKGAKP